MSDDDWREIESGWEDAGEEVEAAPFDDKTPDRLTPGPAAAATAEAETEPEPAVFEEDGDTVFDGDQPTVDYLEDEIPEHVTEFLGESVRCPEEVVVPLAQPAAEEVPASSMDDPGTGLEDLRRLQPASLTLILLVVGVVVAVAAVVYAVFT